MTDVWDEQLAWYCQSSEGDMGLRSSFGSIVSRLEGGQGGTPSESADPSYDRGAVARLNRLEPLWRALSAVSRRRLSAHYGMRPLPPKADARLGRLARAALLLAFEAGELGLLLRGLQDGNGSALVRYRSLAREAVLEAHREFWALRDAGRGA